MGYQFVRALVVISHDGVERRPGVTSGKFAQDFVVSDAYAAKLVAQGFVTEQGVAPEPRKSKPMMMEAGRDTGSNPIADRLTGEALTAPLKLVRVPVRAEAIASPNVTTEAITYTWGPSSQGTANTEYTALGTPTYRFDTAPLIAESKRFINLLHTTGLVLNAAGAAANINSGITGAAGAQQFAFGGGEVEFFYPGSVISICYSTNQSASLRVMVDGNLLTGANAEGQVTGGVATSSNAPQWITITCPDARERKYSFKGLNIKSIICQAGKYISPTKPRSRFIGLGDSFGSRLKANDDPAAYGSVQQLAAEALGIDLVNLGLGGAGFTNAGASATYRAVMEYFAANADPSLPVDGGWFFGSGNDTAATQAAMETEVRTTALRALELFPNAQKWVFTGVYEGFNSQADAARISGYIKNAIDSIGSPKLLYVPLARPEVTVPMFYGTGSVADKKGDGNADFFLSSPGQGAGDRHPNRAGVLHAANYLADRIYLAMSGAPTF